MIFVLLFCLIALLFVQHRLFFRQLLHPSNIVVAVFVISTFFAAANYTIWGDISSLTAGVILLSVVTFSIGSSLGRKLVIGSSSGYEEYEILPDIDIQPFATLLVVFFMLIITILDAIDIISMISGGISGILSIISGARGAVYSGLSISHNFFVQQGIYLCRALAYIYIFLFVYKRINHRRSRFFELIPILLYFVQAALSTGRTEFIYIIYGWLIIDYLTRSRFNRWSKNIDLKFSKKIIIALLAFVIIFLGIANIRSENGHRVQAFETISSYTGSSIIALDNYIQNEGIYSIAQYFGEETMSFVYSIMGALGVSNYSSVATLYPVTIGFDSSTITNIFTAIRRYLHDYGIYGALLIFVSEGFIYGKLFTRLKKKNDPFLSIILYAFISYPIVEISIEERFFSNFITARSVFCIIYICVLYRILLKPKAKNENY
ncbi:O-antigen polymerase [Blautia sp. HCP3S3_G3]|uniref:O-antigen polymerase n=1 Tax=Blautia sp. HCP3S3_G3 TaxID=3438913 RepID=UPI003F8AB8B3